MTTNQQQHVDLVISKVCVEVDKKYTKGVEEHGGNLKEKGLLKLIVPEIRNEILDLIVYTDVLRDHITQIDKLAKEGLKEGHYAFALQQIIRILDGTQEDKA